MIRSEYNLAMTQVAVQGQVWNYQEIGDGTETPILILHGWGRSLDEWRAIAQELSLEGPRKVYVVDLPGFGGSSMPKVKSIFEYSELVDELCKYLGIKKIIAVGHSLGGRIAIVLASKRPTFVERLILIDPAGVKQKSLKRNILKVGAKLFAWMPRQIREKIVHPLMDEDFRNSPAHQLLYRAIVKDDLRNDLQKITCPTQVVWGENDTVLPVQLTHDYRKNLADARVRIVWGAGHDPHLSDFDQTLSIMKEGLL